MAEEETIVVADPSYVGSFPIRQDITVLPADDPKRLKLDWYVHQYTGCEIYRFPKELDLKPIEILDDRYWPRDKDGNPKYHHKITKKEDLVFGDAILIKSLYDYWWNPAIYDGDGVAYTDDNKLYGAFLEFGGDDRNCWCSVMHGRIGETAIFSDVTLPPELPKNETMEKFDKASLFKKMFILVIFFFMFCLNYVTALADQIIWRVSVDGKWDLVEAKWATILEMEDSIKKRDKQ